MVKPVNYEKSRNRGTQNKEMYLEVKRKARKAFFHAEMFSGKKDLRMIVKEKSNATCLKLQGG